jgi:hypothetical protein
MSRGWRSSPGSFRIVWTRSAPGSSTGRTTSSGATSCRSIFDMEGYTYAKWQRWWNVPASCIAAIPSSLPFRCTLGTADRPGQVEVRPANLRGRRAGHVQLLRVVRLPEDEHAYAGSRWRRRPGTRGCGSVASDDPVHAADTTHSSRASHAADPRPRAPRGQGAASARRSLGPAGHGIGAALLEEAPWPGL